MSPQETFEIVRTFPSFYSLFCGILKLKFPCPKFPYCSHEWQISRFFSFPAPLWNKQRLLFTTSKCWRGWEWAAGWHTISRWEIRAYRRFPLRKKFLDWTATIGCGRCPCIATGSEGQPQVIYGLLRWRLWSTHAVLQFSKSLPFIFLCRWFPLCVLDLMYPLTRKGQITAECWLSRKQSFHTPPYTFVPPQLLLQRGRGRRKTERSKKQRYCCVVDWVSSVNHECSALATRSAKRDVTPDAIHSWGLRAFSQRMCGSAVPRGKHLSYWGSDAPSWVRQYPTAPQWSWGKYKWTSRSYKCLLPVECVWSNKQNILL